jgi:hypothetical protein
MGLLSRIDGLASLSAEQLHPVTLRAHFNTFANSFVFTWVLGYLLGNRK